VEGFFRTLYRTLAFFFFLRCGFPFLRLVTRAVASTSDFLIYVNCDEIISPLPPPLRFLTLLTCISFLLLNSKHLLITATYGSHFIPIARVFILRGILHPPSCTPDACPPFCYLSLPTVISFFSFPVFTTMKKRFVRVRFYLFFC